MVKVGPHLLSLFFLIIKSSFIIISIGEVKVGDRRCLFLDDLDLGNTFKSLGDIIISSALRLVAIKGLFFLDVLTVFIFVETVFLYSEYS